MGQVSSIKRLDDDILEKLQDLLRDPRVSQLDATAEINALLARRGQKTVSKSAVNRYAISMNEVGAKLQESREIAKLWIGKLGSQPAGEVGKLLNEVLRTLAFEMTLPMLNGEESPSPKIINQLALAVQRLEKAASDNEKRAAAIRKQVQEEAANEVEAAAREAGLSAEGVQTIKNRILGIRAG